MGPAVEAIPGIPDLGVHYESEGANNAPWRPQNAPRMPPGSRSDNVPTIVRTIG